MKEFDELMKALEAWSNIMLKFGGLKWAPLALQNAYLAFKSAPEPLVLEQADELSLPPDDGSTEGRLDMTDEGTFYFRGISYRLPQEVDR
jgi:hypothetical protein